MIVIGERIKELRKKSRYTQTELANLLGVTKSTIAAYEIDSRLPSYDVLVKMARIFKISIDSLLLNRSDEIIDVSGLNVEQIEIIEKLVISFREHNLMKNLLNDNKRNIKNNMKNETLLNTEDIFKIT